MSREKFVPNPFSNDREARLYRTGDLGRFLPDGRIAYLGRMDEQIKIRGYRIEPQEISAMLDRHPAVQASCVSTYADDSGERRLVAYVLSPSDTRLSPSELLSFAGGYFPDYIVPST